MKWIIAIIGTLFFNYIAFTQEYFNPLDPLGTPYGRVNRNPLEMPEWRDKAPNHKDINFPDVYMPKHDSKSDSKEKNHGDNYKNMSAEDFKKTIEKSSDEQFKSNEDKNTYSKIYSYDPEQTSDPRNYDEVSEVNYSNEQKENDWLGYLGGIGALLIIVIPTYFYYRSIK